MSSSAKEIDLLESFVVGADDDDGDEEEKDAEIRVEEKQALDTPNVGDDLEVYQKSTVEERERQFKDTLKMLAEARLELKRTNENVDLVERLFGESVYELFDWLVLFFGDAHPAEIEAVVPQLTSTWLEVSNLFKSKELAYTWLEFTKSIIHVADEFKKLPDKGVYLESKFLREIILHLHAGISEKARRLISDWIEVNKKHPGSDDSLIRLREEAFNEFINDLKDVYEKATAIAVVFTKLAPSISIEKSQQAIIKHAYLILEQIIMLRAASVALGKMLFHQQECRRHTNRDTKTGHSAKYEETKTAVITFTRNARIVRAQDAQHMIAIGRSLAQKSEVINEE